MRIIMRDSDSQASAFDGAAAIGASRPRAGRPTREQAEARQRELLDRALDHFLDKGYEQATIEAIAADVGMTKRTVYARYPDKASLFRAAVGRAIEGMAVTPEQLDATLAGDLRTTLANLAKLRVREVTTPHGLKLQRIINTESYRFPEIFEDYYELAAKPTIEFTAELLRRETEAGVLAIDKPFGAANLFMAIAVTGPVRLFTAGGTLSQKEIDARVDYAVALFLDGARVR